MSDKNSALHHFIEFLEVPGVLKRLRELSEKYDLIIQPCLCARPHPKGDFVVLLVPIVVQGRLYRSSILVPSGSPSCTEEEREEFIDKAFENFEACLRTWSSPDFKP